MSNVWFTADTHFGHDNKRGGIIDYCDRPYANIEEMDEALIDNWNSVVKHEDTIYHLGDFSFSKKPEKYFHRLNGHKILIVGNHDRQLVKQLPWQLVRDYYEIKIDKQPIVMLHYAMRVWNRSHYGAFHLFGHSHGTLPDDPNALAIDIGVDNHNYTPVSFEEVRQIMKKKSWKPIDHHGR